MGVAARFIVLYGLLYGAFGVSSPFMPRFFESRGLSPEHVGLLFGLGTFVRLVSGPIAGRVADLLGMVRGVLGLCIVAAGGIALGLINADGLWMLLALGVIDAAVLAPTTTLADALALSAAAPSGTTHPRFEYGWVRGAASVAFIAGVLFAGQLLRTTALDAVVGAHAVLLAAAAVAVRFVPPLDTTGSVPTADMRSPVGGIELLLRMPAFRRLVAVAALVLGSHAMHDSFAMVRWNAAGIGPAAGSVLWSESVAAEVVVFLLIGPPLLERLGPSGAAALAALAGLVRWTTMASTTSTVALAVVQPLHGFTFALLHLACMRWIGAFVPPHLAATAQSIYAVGATAMTASMTIVSGPLYADFGARGFLVMALLCAVALPLTRGLRAETVDGPA